MSFLSFMQVKKRQIFPTPKRETVEHTPISGSSAVALKCEFQFHQASFPDDPSSIYLILMKLLYERVISDSDIIRYSFLKP